MMRQNMANPAFVSGRVRVPEFKAPGSGIHLRLESLETGRKQGFGQRVDAGRVKVSFWT